MHYILLILTFLPVSLFGQLNHTILDIPKDLIENANSVVLEENTFVDVSTFGQLTKTYHTVNLILNKKGFEYFNKNIYYDNDSKIKTIKAEILSPFGEKIKSFKKRNFIDVNATDEISMYQDDRVMYLEYTPTSYPFIIELDYEKTTNSTGFIPQWYPVKNSTTAIVKSTYTLEFNPLNKPRFKTNNIKSHNITITETPTKIICEASNIKPIVYEELSGSFKSLLPTVKFALNNFTLKGVAASAKNWKELGNWMHESLLKNQNSLPPSTINEIKNLIKNDTSNIDKARKIYKYVQNKVRYISVQIGIGGWKPMSAEAVDKLSYGDCKALTNYTKALLDVAGVPSYYTVIYAGEKKENIDSEFSRIEGNHAILGIPDNDTIIWLECTSQKKPFGFMGSSTDDRDALMITPKGGEIVHTKSYSLEENQRTQNATINLNTNTTINATVTITSTGLKYDSKYGFEDLTTEKKQNYYKTIWNYLPTLSIQVINITNNKKDIIFTEKIKVQVPNYASKIGKNLLFCPNIFNQNTEIHAAYKNRRHPFKLPKDFKEKASYTIYLPKEFSVEELPDSVSLDSPFGTYKYSITKSKNNTLKFYREYTEKKGTYKPQQYSEFIRFKKTVTKLDKTKIILIRNTNTNEN